MRIFLAGICFSLLCAGCTTYAVTSAASINNEVYATVLKQPGAVSKVVRCVDQGAEMVCDPVDVNVVD